MTVYGAAAERTALAWQRSSGCWSASASRLELGVLSVGVIAALLGVGVAVLLIFVVPSARFLGGHPQGPWAALTTAALAVVSLGALGAVTAFIVLVRSGPG